MIRPHHISICLTLAVSICSPATAQDPQLRMGGLDNRIITSEGFETDIFARRLGNISAMARQDNGTIYTADRQGGQIFRLLDRHMDGDADLVQPLPHRFDAPTGLAVIGYRIFVADRSGVWDIRPGGGTPILLAPFANANSDDQVYPLMSLDSTTLLLGLNQTNGRARMVEINIETGRATLREDAQARILAFATSKMTDAPSDTPARPWSLQQRDQTLYFGSSFQSAEPVDLIVNAVWIDPVEGRVRLALPDGVYETVATFGGLNDSGDPILSGFDPARRPGVKPGVMLSDMRGFFVSDQAGGRVWKIRAIDALGQTVKAPPATNMTEPDSIDPIRSDETTSARPELMRGSGLKRASQLKPAESPQPASTPQE